MDFPRLMYRAPGPEQCQGGTYAQKLVRDEEEFDDALQDGYHGTLPEALAPAPFDDGGPIVTAKLAEADNAPPTSEELRAKAAELGIAVRKNATDESIMAAVTAKLAEG